MATVYLGLGSNLGDRRANLDAGLACLAALPGTALIRVARVRETSPVGGPAGQGDFFNTACVVETALAPRELLDAIHDIERRAGRRRAEETRWGPRTLDMDILLWGDLVMATPELVIPHPRLAEREFALEPLAELAPALAHPVLGLTIAQLLQRIRQSQ